jgi:hypothetical protein
MIRSKLSTKALLLAGAVGLSTAVFAGAQPAAAQTYSDKNSCPAGYETISLTSVPCRARITMAITTILMADLDGSAGTASSATVWEPASIMAQAPPFCGGLHRRV